MGSRLPYYRNVIEKADGLVRGGVGKKPIWLDVAKRFPPLSKPVNGELPKAHIPVRVGPNLNTDGHRFDPKVPTTAPPETATLHPDQPPRIVFKADKLRREFFNKETVCPIHLFNKHSSPSDTFLDTGGDWEAVKDVDIKVDLSLKSNPWLRIPHHTQTPLDKALLQKTYDIIHTIQNDAQVNRKQEIALEREKRNTKHEKEKSWNKSDTTS